MNKLLRILFNKGSTTAYCVISAFFMFVPEECFKYGFVQCKWSNSSIIITNRLLLSITIFVIANIVYCLCHKYRKAVTIKERKGSIKIEYGDITKIVDGRKIINFDECFTTTVGNKPQDVKPDSVCGQYLSLYPIVYMKAIIQAAGIQSVGISQYNQLPRYESGLLIPRDDFLLMAFARLDKNGLGIMSYKQYIDCLDRLWQQIDLYHGTDDVYLPILGSKIIRFDKELNQQELLDIILASYRLSTKRLKSPYTLHIICKKREGFSLNDIFGVS